ncbi:hypothetical protein [Rhodoferax ferrireducens]|uniref:hypothetical protein n=1 Tax=Rhodoferax ferrireducens TaxID=192843 RepID=UPI0013008A7B|nr:hypothetical protein [Rhodoferax ferrireducens]
MAQPAVDFRRIREHRGTQAGGFEELCCQLAALDEPVPGSTFIRKGPGADQGLECYRRYLSRREVGWQAKYFLDGFGNTQVNDIGDSLTRALAAHPLLDTFILCLPVDLRDNRLGKSSSEVQRYEAWRTKRIDQAKAEGRTLEIELWSASSFGERLGRNHPLYSGRLRFWFDATRLTPEWFAVKFDAQRKNLGERYTPESHVDLPIQKVLQSISRDSQLLEKPRQWSAEITSALDNVTHSLRLRKKDAVSEGLYGAVVPLTDWLAVPPVGPDTPVPTDSWSKAALTAEHGVRDALDRCVDLVSPDRSVVFSELYKLYGAIGVVQTALVEDAWQLVNKRVLVVTGPAGIGKSHLLCDFGVSQIAQERVCVLVLTGTMDENDPWEQIRTQLDVSALSTDDFLGALDAAAEAAGCRAVIAIDALNERHGIQLWANRLSGFLATIERFPRVVVAMTVRSTYLRYFPLKGLPKVTHTGFAKHSAQAAKAYLDRRGISRPSAPNVMREFENPLFLRTCCDFLEARGLKQLPKGLTGITQLFDFFMNAVTEKVEQALKLDYHQNIPRKALDAFLVSCAANDAQGVISKEQALELFERYLPSAGRADRSLFAEFLSEGVLTLDFVRGKEDALETVRFTFERLYDHLRAKHLLSTYVDNMDVAGSFKREPLAAYVEQDASRSYGGVIEALAIQLPEGFGLELFDVLPEGALDDQSLVAAFEASIAWRQPQAFTQGTLRWVGEIAQAHGKSAFGALLLVCTEPVNRFNASYLHERLMALDLPERDAGWSMFLAEDDLADGSPVESLIDWAWHVEPEAVEPERRHLAGVALTWFLSSPNRAVRDLATKGLVHLVYVNLSIAAALLDRFERVNDPYITERLLAACYGALMQGSDRQGCKTVAEAVWKQFFAPGTRPPLHLLSRDYALGILEYAHAVGELPAEVELDACRTCFTSDWPLDTVTKDDVEGFKEGGFHDSIVSSTSEHGDFGNYTVRSWLHDITQMPRAFAGRTTKDLFDEWENQFFAAATPKQQEAYVAVQRAARDCRVREHGTAMANFFSKETQEAANRLWASLEAANRAFRAELDAQELQQYENFPEYFLLESTRMNSEDIGPPDVEHATVRRWVCARAHQLGWTPQLFSAFDNGRHISHERMGKHRVERMGKKYQHIALAEAAARVTDNLTVNAFQDRGLLHAFALGPQSLSMIRDIDPSLLLRRTRETGWASTPVTWWTPTQPQLPAGATEVLLAWLQVRTDLCNGPQEIEVNSPDGQQWLVLDGFRHWRVPGQNKRNHSDAWSHITCLVTARGNGRKLAQELLSKHRGDSSRLPADKSLSCFLGEHGWRDNEETLELKSFEFGDFKTPCTGVISRLTAEALSSDNSIEANFTLHVPSAGFMRMLGLRLRNGKAPEYVDSNDIARMVDPSLRTRGPSAGVISRDFFLRGLEHAGFEPIWVLAGEKNVYAAEAVSTKGFGGSVHHTTIYRIEDGVLTCEGELFEDHPPTADQLRALYETK